MAKHIEIGQKGEEIACGYLLKKGYKLVERNYREKYGEIDIIAINKAKILVFVEVKTLKIDNISEVDNSAKLWITPEDNLTLVKLNKVKKTAEFYSNSHLEFIREEKGWQIDLLAIFLEGNGKYLIKHYENVS
ncbi:MAG: YraN family protein [Candidatus Pacebacteria bacterium]|nr:YraN family protein [Candidatus Paceibacterota bacterium]